MNSVFLIFLEGSSPYFENKKVLVLEAQPNNPTGAFDNGKPYSNRVCAISPGSMEFLSELGVWEMIDRKANVRKMQVIKNLYRF